MNQDHINPDILSRIEDSPVKELVPMYLSLAADAAKMGAATVVAEFSWDQPDEDTPFIPSLILKVSKPPAE